MSQAALTLLIIALFLLLLLTEGFLYSFAAAVQCISKEQLSELKEQSFVDEIRTIKEKPQRLVDAIQVVSVSVNVAFGAAFMPLLVRVLYSAFRGLEDPFCSVLSIALAFLITILIILVFGVQLPKQLGAGNSLKYVDNSREPAARTLTITAPIRTLVVWLVSGCLAVFGKEYDSAILSVTEDEILSKVYVGKKQGVLQDSEATMISNIFEYGDKQARDVMTGRGNIDAISADETLSEVMKTVLSGHFSRFPVYNDDLDHIKGVVYLKDVCRMARNEKLSSRPIGSINGLVRKPVFIPEMKNVDDVMKLMQRTHMQMAIVIDEYGQTVGLLTLEDILEEIVGNIQDEYDPDDQYITREGKNQYVVDGQTPLDDMEHILRIKFDTPGDIETVNGFVIYHLQHLPADGEKFLFVYKGWEFRVLSTDNMMVKKVRVRRHAGAEEETTD